MARRKRERDWQERAFEERENRRADKSVGIQSDLPDPFRISTDMPKRSSLRWTAIGLAIIVVAVVVHNEFHSSGPTLTKSCTKPAMALGTTSTHKNSLVHWSVTGPPSSHLVITIGVAALTPGAKPGQLHPVPEAGGTPGTTQLAVQPGVLGSSCLAHGEFQVGVPAGHYTVRLFTLANSGTAQVSGTSVAAKPLTVS
jgi:hypothetical protein